MALLLGWMEVHPPTSEIRISLLAPLGPLARIIGKSCAQKAFQNVNAQIH